MGTAQGTLGVVVHTGGGGKAGRPFPASRLPPGRWWRCSRLSTPQCRGGPRSWQRCGGGERLCRLSALGGPGRLGGRAPEVSEGPRLFPSPGPWSCLWEPQLPLFFGCRKRLPAVLSERVELVWGSLGPWRASTVPLPVK